MVGGLSTKPPPSGPSNAGAMITMIAVVRKTEQTDTSRIGPTNEDERKCGFIGGRNNGRIYGMKIGEPRGIKYSPVAEMISSSP